MKIFSVLQDVMTLSYKPSFPHHRTTILENYGGKHVLKILET